MISIWTYFNQMPGMGTVGVCNIVRYSTQQITSLRLISQSERLLYGVIIHLSLAENLGG